METIDILKTESVSITFDKQEEVLKIKLLDNTEYNDAGFKESLEYLKNTFVYIDKNNLKCSFICDLRCNTGSELPLHAYVKIVNVITDINSVLLKNCHCVVIITTDSNKWREMYNFITKLWSPSEQRPIEFMNNEDNLKEFILKNKLL